MGGDGRMEGDGRMDGDGRMSGGVDEMVMEIG